MIVGGVLAVVSLLIGVLAGAASGRSIDLGRVRRRLREEASCSRVDSFAESMATCIAGARSSTINILTTAQEERLRPAMYLGDRGASLVLSGSF
jgi:hypothetical protein